MKPAWTTQLFIKINNNVGKWPVVDRLMMFAAHYLIFVLISFILFAWYRAGTVWQNAWTYGYIFFLSLVTSYAIAFFLRQRRPVKQLPHITVLIRTFGTWKSFPSDHTIAATILSYAGWQVFSGSMLVLFVCFAILVAVSRVWVGVHYPRDIVGGFLLAGALLFFLG